MQESETPTNSRSPSSRARMYSSGIVVAVLISVVIASIAAQNSEAPAEELGGDYPAFYGAGRLASENAWDDLYEFDRQVEAQSDLQPSDETTARFFAYPPQVALAYRPLAALDYHWSYLVHTLLMAAALWLAILLARPMVPWLRGREMQAMAAALLFWPMFRTVTGGSNTALTVLLVAAAWRLVHEDRPYAAGLVIAALLYKPQFALPIGGLFLIARHWRVAVGAVAGGIPFFALGVVLQGGDWAWDWVDRAAEFGELDAEVNGFSSISFLGFFQNAFGVDAAVANVLGWSLAALTAAALAWLWWRGPGDLDVKIALTMPGLLLMSPHAMSHDGALAMITVAVVVGVVGLRTAAPWLAVIWILGATQLWISSIGFSPGFPMLLLMIWWALRTTGVWLPRESQPSHGRSAEVTAA